VVEDGGSWDMEDVKTEEDMNRKMETIDKRMLEEAADNVPLQVRTLLFFFRGPPRPRGSWNGQASVGAPDRRCEAAS
jgi:hypothetical protein